MQVRNASGDRGDRGGEEGAFQIEMAREGLTEEVTFEPDLKEVREYAGWISEGRENGRD